jgi:hypothetical protein
MGFSIMFSAEDSWNVDGTRANSNRDSSGDFSAQAVNLF